MKINLSSVSVYTVGLVLLFAGTAMADYAAPIPEPATTSLLLMGAGAYLLARRRQKKQKK